MSLQEKLEKARQNLNLSIDTAEDIASEELIDNVQEPELLTNIETVQGKPGGLGILMDSPQSQADVIQLYQLTQDFQYIRETLRENQQNGRRVLRSVQNDILDSEDDKKASLIMSFQELNKAIQDNIKLYISTYKTISDTLKNLQTINEKAGESIQGPSTKGVKDVEVISTADILARLQGE